MISEKIVFETEADLDQICELSNFFERMLSFHDKMNNLLIEKYGEDFINVISHRNDIFNSVGVSYAVEKRISPEEYLSYYLE